MTDLNIINYDLVYKNGDFELSSLAVAMPIVLEITTRPGSWDLDKYFGFDLKRIRESASLEDIKMLFVRFKDVTVSSMNVEANKININLLIGGSTVNVSV